MWGNCFDQTWKVQTQENESDLVRVRETWMPQIYKSGFEQVLEKMQVNGLKKTHQTQGEWTRENARAEIIGYEKCSDEGELLWADAAETVEEEQHQRMLTFGTGNKDTGDSVLEHP